MGPVGIILVNPPITTLQQSLTHSAMMQICLGCPWFYPEHPKLEVFVCVNDGGGCGPPSVPFLFCASGNLKTKLARLWGRTRVD